MSRYNIDNTLTGQIIRLVCETWQVSRADLIGRSHRRPLPWARSQLCQYLRIYAGHTADSCAAMLHIRHQSVTLYQLRYQHLLDTYRQFNDNDARIKAQVKVLCQ